MHISHGGSWFQLAMMMSLRDPSSGLSVPTRRRRQDVSEEEREEIRECFALFDADGDGALEYRYARMVFFFPLHRGEPSIVANTFVRI